MDFIHSTGGVSDYTREAGQETKCSRRTLDGLTSVRVVLVVVSVELGSLKEPRLLHTRAY